MVLTWAFAVERVRGIEPPLSAWEADVLPLNYTRVRPSGAPTRTSVAGARRIGHTRTEGCSATPQRARESGMSQMNDY